MSRQILFTDACMYRLRIEGVPHQAFMDIIENYINKPELTIHSKVTTITGFVKDQAALSGLLNVFYENRYIILSIQKIDEN